MRSNNQPMPALMQRLHQIQFDYLEGRGIDFEPYEAFLSVEDTQNWFRAWTGNADVDGKSYLVFGQDGTGGYAALYLKRDGTHLLDQPIVFFGSEGDMGVITQNFSDYLWLLASGHGPYEAVTHPDDDKTPDVELLKFAINNATLPQSKPSEIIGKAKAEFPTFEPDILSMCR